MSGRGPAQAGLGRAVRGLSQWASALGTRNRRISRQGSQSDLNRDPVPVSGVAPSSGRTRLSTESLSLPFHLDAEHPPPPSFSLGPRGRQAKFLWSIGGGWPRHTDSFGIFFSFFLPPRGLGEPPLLALRPACIAPGRYFYVVCERLQPSIRVTSLAEAPIAPAQCVSRPLG